MIPFGMGFPVPDDETREKLRQMLIRQQMQQEEFHNSVKRLLLDCPTEYLVTFRQVLLSTLNDPQLGSFYDGVFANQLEMGRGLCASHGVVHDEANPHMLFEPEFEPEPEPEKEAKEEESEKQTVMEEYGVELVDPQNPTGPVKCVRCRQSYTFVSLGDRMLDDASTKGCPQCMQEARWG
jgi:hypothetical protein